MGKCRSIEETWVSEMSCCHTSLPYHMGWVTFHLHCEMQVVLNPKVNISVMDAVTNCVLIV